MNLFLACFEPALPTNLAESLLHALRAHGAKQIFGIPGDFALPYFRIIEQSAILPLYTLSHEPGVGAINIKHTALIAPGNYATMGNGVRVNTGTELASAWHPAYAKRLLILGDGMVGAHAGDMLLVFRFIKTFT